MSVVRRHREVIRCSPMYHRRITDTCGAEIIEVSIRITPDRNVAFSVAVIVVLSVKIGTGYAKDLGDQTAVRALEYIPWR